MRTMILASCLLAALCLHAAPARPPSQTVRATPGRLVAGGAGDPAVEHVSYVGGTGFDAANAVTVDGQGNIYLAGVTTSSDLPATSAAAQRVRSISPDCFVAKLDSTGRVLWMTYLGGNNGRQDYESDTERPIAVRVDAAGNVFVAGSTQSTDFPTTANAWQSRPQYNVSKGFDGFLAKLSPDGSSLIFSTYIGGRDGSTHAAGLAVDSTGDAYVAGTTSASAFPATTTLGPPGTRARVFVTKFAPSGALLYSARLGGESSYDVARALAVDATGQAHVAGVTSSRAFPMVVPWIPACPAGEYCQAGFLVKLSAAGDRILYSTYLGGSTTGDRAATEIDSVAVDAAGGAVVAGRTSSTTLPILKAAQKTYGGGYADLFLVSLTSSGQPRYATYFGGGGSEAYDLSMAADAAGSVYVTGRTQSTDLPLVTPLLKGSEPRAVLRGVRQGNEWSGASHGLNADVAALVVDPVRPGVMYAGTGEGVYRTDEAGNRWTNSSTGLPDTGSGRRVTALAIDSRSTQVLFVSTRTGTYRSTDGASTWDLVDEVSYNAYEIVLDPRNPGTVLAGGGSFGIRRSTDSGATWTSSNSGLGPYASVWALALDVASGTWLAATLDAVFRSNDGGLSWSPSNQGITARYLVGLAVDPWRPRTVYAFGDGLFASADAGVTWSSGGFPQAVRSFAVGRRRVGTFYLGVGEPATSDPCLRRSPDRGATWEPLWPDTPACTILGLVADPHRADEIYAIVPLLPVSFLARLAPDGSFAFSSYLPVIRPSAISLDAFGRVHLAGGIAPAGGLSEAFVARVETR